MSLVIPDEFLQTAHISEADLKLEIALLLFQQKKITLGTASRFASMNLLEFQSILSSRKIPTPYGVEEFRLDLDTFNPNGVDQPKAQPSQTEILQRIEQRRTFSSTQHQLPDTLTLLQEDRTR